MKLKERIKKLDLKTILMFGIPLILGLLLVVVIVKKRENNADVNNGNVVVEALIPDSEEDKLVENKLEAYGVETAEARRKQQESDESVLKNSDFFKEVIGEKDNGKLRQEADIEEYYERTVLNVTKKQGATKTDESKHLSPAKKAKTKPASAFADDEDDPILESYNKAKSVSNSPFKKEENIDNSQASGKTTSLSAKLSKRKEENAVDIFELENDPKSYARTRKRTSVSETSTNLIKACIHGDQTITNGTNVKMRLLEHIAIEGMEVPRNTIFYGIAQIQSERLSIKVSNLKINSGLANVKFTIYDNDAIQGLNLPDNIKDELAKEAKKTAASGVSVNTGGGGGIVGTAVSSTIGVAKKVFTKDQSQIKVTLKTNYQIFIKEN